MCKNKNLKKTIIILALLSNLASGNFVFAELSVNPTIPDKTTAQPNSNTQISPSTQVQSIQNQTKENIPIENEKKPTIPPIMSDDQSKLLLQEIPLKIAQNQVTITLEDCLKKALENNFDIKIITTQKDQNKWLYYNSMSNYLPSLGYSYTEQRFSGAFLIGGVLPSSALPGGFPSSISATSITSGATLQWPIFTGFARLFQTKEFNFKYKATKKNIEFTKDQVLSQTANLYYTLLRNKINIDIQKKALEQTESQLQLNKERYNAGVGTKFDVLRSESEVASSQQTLIASYNTFKLSQAQLANLIGIDVFTALMPAETEVKAIKLLNDNLTLNDITQIAIKSRPDINIATLNVAAAKATRNTGFSQYLPQVILQGGIEQVGSELNNLERNQVIGFSVNWNALNNMGVGSYTNIRALNEQLKESKLRVITTTRNVEQNIVNSYYNSISASEVIKAAKKEVDSAEESLRLSVVRLQAGVGIYTDVIAAQLTETNAKVNYLNSIINYNTAQSQLLFDMGVISVNNLLQGYEPSNVPPKKIK